MIRSSPWHFEAGRGYLSARVISRAADHARFDAFRHSGGLVSGPWFVQTWHKSPNTRSGLVQDGKVWGGSATRYRNFTAMLWTDHITPRTMLPPRPLCACAVVHTVTGSIGCMNAAGDEVDWWIALEVRRWGHLMGCLSLL